MQNLEHFLWEKFIHVSPADPKTLGIMVVILFLLISFLFNLLQRRRSRTRLDRLLENEKSVLNFLGTIDEYLGKLERSCAFELRGARSPQEIGKAIYVARDKIKSMVAAMEKHLCAYNHDRRKGKKQETQRKRLSKSLKNQT